MKLTCYTAVKILAILLFGSSMGFSQTDPQVDFVSQTEVCVGEEVSFVDQSVQGTDPIISYTWNFGDGSNSTQQNPTHFYTTPGTYTVTLVVQTQGGGAFSEVKANYITVHPVPEPDFSLSANSCSVPVTVTFTNTTPSGGSFKWDFGNGQTSQQQNPSPVTYNSEGNYTIQLIATNQFGCSDTISKSFEVSDFKAAISAPTSACVGEPITISDNSTLGANAWSWKFSGGTPSSSSTASTQVTYNTPGTYTVTLTSKNTTSGCSSSASTQIVVNPLPTASFTNNPMNGCSPLTVQFTTTGAQAGATYNWDFGNGQTSTTQNPQTTYVNNGAYSITLTMTSAEGCTDSITQQSVTLESPEAGFTSDVDEGCTVLDVNFIDTSKSATTITKWEWDFGNGSTFIGQNPPTQSYSTGLYDVTLIITTADGCVDTITRGDYVQVGEIDKVNFGIDTSPECANEDIKFTDSTIISVPHQSSEVVYYWEFEKDGSSTQKNPTYQFETDTGYFDITLIVDFRGCKDTLIKEDVVYIKGPIAKFELAEDLFCNPSSLPITAATVDSTILGETSDNCEMVWNWGDGTQTVLDDAYLDVAGDGDTTHQYSNYGTYTVELIAYNYTTGCSDTITRNVNVSSTEAIMDVLANDSICVGDSLLLSQSSISGHPFGNYMWEMGNGDTLWGSSVKYAYPAFGNYTIKLIATNNVGCADSTTFAPFTALALPQADVVAQDLIGCPPFAAVFENHSTKVNNGVDLDSFTFTFLDDGSKQNTSSTTENVTHIYKKQGNYQAYLVATDQFGCISYPDFITITVTKPDAQFIVDSVVCENEQVLTINSSTGEGPLSYEWFVNNNSVSTDSSFMDTYLGDTGKSSTIYSYQLVVTDKNGCKDTLTQDVIVSTPIADFIGNLSGASTNDQGEFTCPPVFADFSDNSTSYGTIVSQSWDFGNGTQSSLSTPQNTYVFPGSYDVLYEITDEFGCKDDTTLVNFLTVAGPIGSPEWSQSVQNCGQIVTFELKDTSSVTHIVWNFDDGSTKEDSVNVVHHYKTINYFIPTVTLFDESGCEVEHIMDTVFIDGNGLNAIFTASTDEAALGENIVFYDYSQSPNSTIVSWTWQAENKPPVISSTGENYNTGYAMPGKYVVSLLIQDNHGCVDSAAMLIQVTNNLPVPNVFTPNGDGVNDQFSFIFEIFETYDVLILNRWGNVIVDKQNLKGTVMWNGKTVEDKKCTDGIYFYKIKGVLKGGVELEKHGFVTLLNGE